MTSGSRMRAIVLGLCGMVLLCTGTARGGFAGEWVNIDSTPNMLAKVDIASALFQLNIHPWGQCVPLCDWGVQSKSILAIPGNQFSLEYDFGFKKATLTLTLVSEGSLWVHEFHDFTPGDGRTDFTLDEYFQREGSGPAKPDLVVSALTIPKPVVIHGMLPRTNVTLTVKNIGPGILETGSLRAKLSGSTRNGEAFSTGGFYSIAYSAPLYPGQTATHSFAVGHDFSWPVGVYSLGVKVDPDDLIDEDDERNNLSPKLAFDIADERYLAGTVTYNHQPLRTRTSLSPGETWITNSVTSQAISGYDFWYDPSTSHYLISGLPDASMMIVMRFEAGGGQNRPGNFEVAKLVKLPLLSDAEAADYELASRMLLHLVEPWDNRFTAESNMVYNCEPFAFAWEAVPGATKYQVMLTSYRDSEHPAGFGYIGTLEDLWTTELSYDPALAPSAELEHYQFYLTGYNDADELLGALNFVFPDGYGIDYRFKVCGSCSRADINRDCRVNMRDLAILAEEWLVDTR
jgi:hypothetical protein